MMRLRCDCPSLSGHLPTPALHPEYIHVSVSQYSFLVNPHLLCDIIPFSLHLSGDSNPKLQGYSSCRYTLVSRPHPILETARLKKFTPHKNVK